ncbi:PA3496 family putative envelope integrity protein [Aquipseudomonas campi]
MSRHHDDLQAHPGKSRRQQEDLRRMQFRRAIEDYSEQRRLSLQIADFPELIAANAAVMQQAAGRRSARPAR